MLGDGPYFAAGRFSLVDAVFAPVFRYFDVFDGIVALGVFDGLPKVGSWRAALSQRPSVRDAVGPDYRDRLLAFLEENDAYLAQMRREPSPTAG